MSRPIPLPLGLPDTPERLTIRGTDPLAYQQAWAAAHGWILTDPTGRYMAGGAIAHVARLRRGGETRSTEVWPSDVIVVEGLLLLVLPGTEDGVQCPATFSWHSEQGEPLRVQCQYPYAHEPIERRGERPSPTAWDHASGAEGHPGAVCWLASHEGHEQYGAAR